MTSPPGDGRGIYPNGRRARAVGGPRRALVATALLALVGGLVFVTAAGARGFHAGFETGDLSELDQASTASGTLAVESASAFRGRRAARAVYSGNGANGYARGIFEVSWQNGDRVSYGAAFRLPNDFYESMQGQVALLRWDNWPSYQSADADVGGVVIYGSDHRARLMRSHYGSDQETIGRSFKLPEGRWFRLSVDQRLGSANAFSRVRLDGRTVISSHAPNSFGRAIDRLRFGLVAIAAGDQRSRLELLFDEARARPG